jgi:tetratricopeptide (TPR) repeat protein
MKHILAGLIFAVSLSGAVAQVPGIDAENALIVKATEAFAARNWQEAERVLKQLTVAAPARWQYQKSLGDAQNNQARWQDALDSYERAIALAEKSSGDANVDRTNVKAALGDIFTAKGNVLLRLKKNTEATAAYTRAAALSPNPAVAYFNLCATLYNSGKMEDAVAACDKAIAADRNKADAYFIKGSALFGEGKLDQNGKFVVSAAAIQALQKYLALAPDGAHASDVKEMLAAVDIKVSPGR